MSARYGRHWLELCCLRSFRLFNASTKLGEFNGGILGNLGVARGGFCRLRAAFAHQSNAVSCYVEE